VFWYTDQQDKRSYQRYEIYFPGSVSGLTAGSPVRYLGVDVGKVVRIKLDPQQHKTVQVIADIDSTAPIDDRTRASLSLQGVTGLLFIDLEQDPKAESTGIMAQGQNYPMIRSRRSDFDVLLSNLPALTTHLVELADHFNNIFSDENVRALKETLDNARLASEHLPGTVREVQQLVADVRRTTQEVQGTLAELRGVITGASPDLKTAFANIRQISDNLAKTTTRLNAFVAENEPGFSRFSKQSLPEFEQLLRESRQAARDFRDLSRSLKQNPSQLIYESTYRGIEVPK
jgi:phospholipid/cholesterol/gamma-HCH transport system substrate-binding protein